MFLAADQIILNGILLYCFVGVNMVASIVLFTIQINKNRSKTCFYSRIVFVSYESIIELISN